MSRTLKRGYYQIQNIFQVVRNSIQLAQKQAVSPIQELEGIKVAGVGSHLSSNVAQSIYGGCYEQAEIQMLKSCLSQEDIVMEIGAGIGFLSTYCAKAIGSDRVFAYEANPKLEKVIRSTYQINNVYPNLQICLIGEETKMQYFYVTKDFWSASFIKPTTEEAIETISVAMKSFDQEVQKINPSLLIVDIEGGEYEMFRDANLHNIQKIIIELHNSLIGSEKVDLVKKRLSDSGFQVAERIPNCDDEILLLKRLNT